MKHASPATVSRGGVLFINETDVGWKPFLESWRETLPDQIAQSQFYLLFSYYFEQVSPERIPTTAITITTTERTTKRETEIKAKRDETDGHMVQKNGGEIKGKKEEKRIERKIERKRVKSRIGEKMIMMR